MKNFLLFFFLLHSLFLFSQEKHKSIKNRIISTVDSTNVNNMVLQQSFTVNASLNKVWEAYTTKKGWENWAVAVAEIDFKIGGLIKTNYNKNAKIGNEGTITLHVINFIPKKMITLQAELTENFPEFMKEDSKKLFNVITFKEIDSTKTKITSYGIGYKKTAKYKSLLQFFIQGNEKSYLNLITYLETNKPSVKY